MAQIPASLDRSTFEDNSKRAGGPEWRETEEVLWRELRGDLRDAEEQLKASYPKNYSKIHLRTVPFIQWVAKQHATPYLNPPMRTFDGLTPDQVARVEAQYGGAGVDRKLLYAHQHLTVLRNACVFVFPVPQISGWRVVLVPPHHVEVELEDPFSDNVRDVKRVWLRLPLPGGWDRITGQQRFGIAEITAERAHWVQADGDLQGQSIWGTGPKFKDGRNPIGAIPLVQLRGAEPAPGEWFSAAPEHLLNASRALNADFTDIGTIARLQGFGQMWAKGMTQSEANEQNVGPFELIAMQDPEAQLNYASARPDLASYQNQNEGYTRQVIATHGLNPATFLRSTAVTAVAKALETADRDIERSRHLMELRSAEQSIYNLASRWSLALRDFPLPKATVKVEYREKTVPADPLHEAQADKLLVDMGIVSPAEIIAKRKGLTQSEAEAQYAANKAALPDQGGQP